MDDFDTDNDNKNNALQDILAPYFAALSTDDTPHARKLPTVDKWSPTRVSDFPLIIKQNGDWYHDGTKMTRQSLIDLFASVLWGELGDDTDPSNQSVHYYLKTPSDLYRISVEDVPLSINDVSIVLDEKHVAWIQFVSSHGDVVRLDDEHSLYFGGANTAYTDTKNTHLRFGNDPNALYIKVRGLLHAKLTRSVFYHLINIGTLQESADKTSFTLTSGNKNHTLFVDNAV